MPPTLSRSTRRAAAKVMWSGTTRRSMADPRATRPPKQILGGSGWTSNPWRTRRSRRARADGPGHLAPQHVDHRRDVSSAAAGRRSRRLHPHVHRRAREGIESIARASITFRAGVIRPHDRRRAAVPIAVAAEWLGLDADSAALLREESPAISRMSALSPTPSCSSQRGRVRDADDPIAAAGRRPAHAPRDDLLSFVARRPGPRTRRHRHHRGPHRGRRHETTANLLGAGLVRLLTPAPTTKSPARGHRSTRADRAVTTELLRLDAPVQSTVRTATQDQRIGGVDVAAGPERHSSLSRRPIVTPRSSSSPTPSDSTAPVRLRCPSGMARTIASARPWRGWRSPPRCREFWPAGQCSPEAGDVARHPGHPRPGLRPRRLHGAVAGPSRAPRILTPRPTNWRDR